MKLLLITNMYPSPENPIYGVFVRNFQLMLEEKGVVFSKVVTLTDPSKNKLIKLCQYAGFYLKTLFHAMFSDYDAIYVHNASHPIFPLVMIKSFIRKPIFINAHGTDILSNNFLNRMAKKCLKSLIHNSQNTLVVPSEFLKQTIQSKLQIADDRFLISPSGGVDLDVFNPDAEPPPLMSKLKQDSQRLVGYYSRLTKDKGCLDFIEAFCSLTTKIPDVSAIILGDGPELTTMQSKIKAQNLEHRVHFIGKVDQKTAANFLASLDILVFPTHLPESLGLVALEAMACGVPVIAQNVGAVSEYLHHDTNGYLVDQITSTQVSEALITFFRLSSDTRSTFRTSALQESHKFDRRIVARDLYIALSTKVGAQ